jgi:hypothetical protein
MEERRGAFQRIMQEAKLWFDQYMLLIRAIG